MELTSNLKQKQRNIYVVVSDSGSRISKILRIFTKAKYNHVSLALREDLQEMYSFGRRWKYYAFYGGFIKETPYTGVFGVYPKADIVVFPFDVTETQYKEISARIEDMYRRKKHYKYSWLGLFMLLFHKKVKRKHYYYCSEFVQEILTQFSVVEEGIFPLVTKPHEFLHIFQGKQTYVGRYRDYAVAPTAQAMGKEKETA